MYEYKFLTKCGVTLAFESKYHIRDIKPIIFSNGATFVRFEDSEFVIELKEIKDVEVNGVKYQIRTYAN